MSDAPLYNVNCTGQIKQGHSPRAAVNAFARLANIEHGKAAAIIKGQKTIKKSLPLLKANALKAKLERIGLIIEVRGVNDSAPASGITQAPPMATPETPKPTAMTLSLEPIDRPEPEETPQVAGEEQTDLPEGYMSCPKCQAEQPEAAECANCGVVIAKASPNLSGSAASAGLRSQSAHNADDDSDDIDSYNDAPTHKILMAAGAGAVVGALAWYWVAMAFQIELGILAWARGGLIGSAAIYFGANGDNAGYLCGTLALVAIISGKFIVASALSDEYFENIVNMPAQERAEFLYNAEETLAAMDEVLENDQVMENDQILRQHLFDINYMDATSPDDISSGDLYDFRREVLDNREQLAALINSVNDGTAKEKYGLESTINAFKASFGFIDILFLLFGVSTAFKMAREGRSIRSRF
ncbi:hypothetical protein [Gilvimarinus sp. 1_MG-2023]|uniref:hypothetical protein n=1 Tax=Gilvimarinus sp. 1_MG-2023 TaxID=3062638 RepID=UPI0026E1C11F|nr:hypothetical protein [Gilvimarinus sp. 1_MG-2023]MDO6746229.1 hypothetical protein [Gilvimarinus sp. 1_MG-2023]